MNPNGGKIVKESVFFGIMKKFLWRNEKNGASFFLLQTKMPLLLEQMYSKKEVRQNKLKEDIVWYTMTCDGTKTSVPYIPENTPVMIKGYFNQNGKAGYSWSFVLSEIKETSIDETTSIEYLASGSFPGISYEDAVKIVSSFGSDVFAMAEMPNIEKRLVQVTQLPEVAVTRMLKLIRSTVAEREVFQELYPLEIPYPVAAKAVKHYGEGALKVIKKSPYKAGKALGLSFSDCDKLAFRFGHSFRSPLRIEAGVFEACEQIATQGHVYCPQADFYNVVYRVLTTGAFGEEISRTAIATETRKIVTGDIIGGIRCFYINHLYESEENIANHICRLSLNPEKNPYTPNILHLAEEACGMKYGKQQSEAFPNLLATKGVKILTGGPGTGKTTTLKGLIFGYQYMYPDAKVRLCAPTGRAAQRMSESTGMEAVTIHRLCDYKPFGLDSVSHLDESNPIDADLIVVDEVSMCPIDLMEILLGAIKSGCSLWLIGDVHQLESVGAGAILHDCLKAPESLIARTLLTEVFRQKGGSPIIENANRINSGNCDLQWCDDFQYFHTENEEETLEIIKKLSKEFYDEKDPFSCQILCPARKGISGIDNCNIILQEMLNPAVKGAFMTYGRTQFRVKDKIIMTNNKYQGESPYYNGDIGIVVGISDKGLIVDIRNERMTLERSDLENIRLSYGMTIHKSQGSEFPIVIVVMPENPSNMLVRNLLYTAVTRAKKRVYIINEGSAMQTAIKVDKSGSRQTTLGTRLAAIK